MPLGRVTPDSKMTAPLNLSLTLESAAAVENLIGGSGDDRLTGNSWATRSRAMRAMTF